MDSRLLYSATESLKYKLDYHIKNKPDFIHFGTGLSVKYSLVNNIIKSHFENDVLYLVYKRTKSGLLNTKEIKDTYKLILGKETFHLWNKDFTKAISFDKIGVLRIGKII